MSGPSDSNAQKLHRTYAAFAAGDLPAVLAAFAPDGVLDSVGDPAFLPLSGRYAGRAEIPRYFTVLDGLVEHHGFHPDSTIAEGERVVVLGHSKLKFRATGRYVEVRWVHVVTFRDGLIAEVLEFADTALAMAAHRDL